MDEFKVFKGIEITNDKMQVVIISLLALSTLLISCGNTEEEGLEPKSVQSTTTSLSLGEEELEIDSISAKVWFSEQVEKDILTAKIYCTSSYPISDQYILQDNDITYLRIQTILEKGRHEISDNGDNWINSISYEFTHISNVLHNRPEVTLNWIVINGIDKDNQLVSFDVHATEYVSINAKVRKDHPIKKVVFKGVDIPYTSK